VLRDGPFDRSTTEAKLPAHNTRRVMPVSTTTCSGHRLGSIENQHLVLLCSTIPALGCLRSLCRDPLCGLPLVSPPCRNCSSRSRPPDAAPGSSGIARVTCDLSEGGRSRWLLGGLKPPTKDPREPDHRIVVTSGPGRSLDERTVRYGLEHLRQKGVCVVALCPPSD